jgi:hypothetical protein
MVSRLGNLRVFVLVFFQVEHGDINGQKRGFTKQENSAFYCLRGFVRVAI